MITSQYRSYLYCRRLITHKTILFSFYVLAKACRERWTRIRDNHRKALNLRKTRSGQATPKLKPPKFEKELSFLVPYIFDEESRESNISSQLSQDNESYLEDAYDEIIDRPTNVEDTDDISPLSSTSRSSGRKRKTSEPTAASVLQEYLQKKKSK